VQNDMDKHVNVTNNMLKVGKLFLSHVVLNLVYQHKTKVDLGTWTFLKYIFFYLGDFLLCAIEFNSWLIKITSIPNIRNCSRTFSSLLSFPRKMFHFLGLITSLLLLLTTCMAFFNVGCPFWQIFIHFLTKKRRLEEKKILR
jgi:hypothetical protein